jgi:hypothetical protein
MDPRLEQQLRAEAHRLNLNIEESFIRHLDSYVQNFFPQYPTKDRLVVQTYLADAGLRIAKAEGKQVVQREDAKAAIYYFHLPDDPDSTCIAAGNRVLLEERTRSRFARGRLLSDNLRRLLDQTQ